MWAIGKRLDPPRIIVLKRELDKEMHVFEALFPHELHRDYDVFMETCFKTFGGSGTDARLRTGYKIRKQVAQDSWRPEWERSFEYGDQDDDYDLRVKVEKRSTYGSLMASFGDALGVTDNRRTRRAEGHTPVATPAPKGIDSVTVLQPLNPPIPDAYWVVPGQLLAGEYPGAKDAAAARRKLRLFLDAEFTFFLDLTEEGEPLAPYAPALLEEAAARHLAVEHCRMPIPDLGTPQPAEVTRILDTIDAAIAAGRRVYVHCWGGIGRTGTIVGCYLVRHGQTGDQALAEIARRRQGTPDDYRVAPETHDQRERVRNWPLGG